MKNILVTGGCGFVGTSLVPMLIENGYHVIVLDSMIFGNKLLNIKSRNLEIIKDDIRNMELLNELTKKTDSVIHLAALSNDASCDLNEKYARQINYNATINLIELCIKNNVKHFIFASSASVYGVQNSPADENTFLNPITLYGKLKLGVENYLKSQNKLDFTIVRPATLSGFSPRLRLDLSVNVLTYSGFYNGTINVFGGTQFRPNLNVLDMSRFYVKILSLPLNKVQGKIYNVSGDNYSMLDFAKLIQAKIKKKPDIKIVKTNDLRSYMLDGSKAQQELGFICKYSIDYSINSLIEFFYTQPQKVLENDKYWNVNEISKVLNQENIGDKYD